MLKDKSKNNQYDNEWIGVNLTTADIMPLSTTNTQTSQVTEEKENQQQ